MFFVHLSLLILLISMPCSSPSSIYLHFLSLSSSLLPISISFIHPLISNCSTNLHVLYSPIFSILFSFVHLHLLYLFSSSLLIFIPFTHLIIYFINFIYLHLLYPATQLHLFSLSSSPLISPFFIYISSIPSVIFVLFTQFHLPY